MATSFLDAYESLDIIGNGSFGIIRKVRRKADGKIFAQKELNFQRMSDRDKKQIVSEVNILKDLNNEHIVRYHDRSVDKDAGFLYIMMEYCGGGDLAGVIKQAAKHNRPIPEDTIWNYFMQILLALQYCHHPGSSSTRGGVEGEIKRPQILHRDLKPDNVFLDESNTVKLGDFGLSKALPQASFANTYVGTPYYMSPEVMQEKAYDSKSDIWSLGCLIYELCALKPPFHEAKTHAELNLFIRNGRIPPLPRGYSNSLTNVIKSMLSLNPAMRPSATQLLQHERLELAFKVCETEKLLLTVKNHKRTMTAKERELMAREAALLENEQRMYDIIAKKDTEISNLHQMVAQLQQQKTITPHDVELSIKTAIARREDELRVLVMKREEEVATAMAAREEEILAAVRKREAEVCEAWVKKEDEIRVEFEAAIKEVEDRTALLDSKEDTLKAEEARLEAIRLELEERTKSLDDATPTRKAKTPLEEVKNLLAPLQQMTLATENTPMARRVLDNARTKLPLQRQTSILATPIARPRKPDILASSAMKGVVLTATGEVLATPAPVQLTSIIIDSPKVGLNFAKIFDFDTDDSDKTMRALAPSSPPSPSSRKEKEKQTRRHSLPPEPCEPPPPVSSGNTANPIRRKASRASFGRPTIGRSSLPSFTADSGNQLPTSTSRSTGSASSSASSSSAQSALSSGSTTSTSISSIQSSKPMEARPTSHPHFTPATSGAPSTRTQTLPSLPFPRAQPPPEYDFTDEENLPSPFLKRIDRTPVTGTNVLACVNPANEIPLPASTTGATAPVGTMKKKRQSGGTILRAMAAANSVAGRGSSNSVSDGAVPESTTGAAPPRPSLMHPRRATEETRKVILRT